jgi:uncharacterized membrane protein YhaH (DUF805 family)
MDIVSKCMTKKYLDFSTRAQRKEFWFFVLFYVGGVFILTVTDIAANTYDEESGIGLFTSIFLLLTFIPYLAVSVRRIHDTNRTGWWVLILIIPLIGAIWLIVLYCLRGNQGENKFGEDPLSAESNDAPRNI